MIGNISTLVSFVIRSFSVMRNSNGIVSRLFTRVCTLL